VQSLWFLRLLPFALISLLGSGVLLATGARLRRAEAARLQAEADARWAMARANHADALGASEARSRLAIEATGLGTWDEDMRTRQTTWNEHAYRIFGFRPGRDTMTSATWRERVHPDDWPQVAEAYRTALKDGALAQPVRQFSPQRQG
jgi:PAS domain-containing protein